jgi:osmotically-inducible protein OsmY
MRNNQYSDRDRSTTDQLVRELDNLPVGRSKEFYKNTLRQRGYEITKVNKDDSDEMSVEAVKNGNSVQLDISFDENTAQSTEIDASTLWAESESTTRTREAQERTLDSRSSSGRTPDMNRDDDRRTDAGTDDGQALLGSGKMAKEDRTGSTGPSGTRSTSIPNTGAVDTAGRVTKPACDEAVTEVDRGLASGIRSSLLGHPDFSGSGENIHLIVNNGFVTIQGWVPSEQDRRAIADRIQEQAGVQGIDNQLLVRSQTSLDSRR